MHGLGILLYSSLSTRRLIYPFIASFLCLLILGPPYYYHRESKRPPTWTWLKNWEHDLPQHDLSLPYPEGATGRYLKFSMQSQRLGFNNVLAELLMNAHLAYESRRGFVFPDYQWEITHYPFPKSLARTLPPRTPLPALISGPTAGGPWESDDETGTPRSISSEYFDIVCPPHKRRLISSTAIKSGRSGQDGRAMLEAYTAYLDAIPERCVEIIQTPEDGVPQLFDLWLWGDPRLLSLWESFSTSPTSRLLGASPIVKAAVDRNEYVLGTAYDRVLAMHLRRGDFELACANYAKYSSRFNGWNQLAFLPDRFSVPGNETERTAYYEERCSPTVEGILGKVRQAQKDHQGVVDTVYLMTNEKGDSEWLGHVIDVLRQDGFGNVVTSRDLVFETIEQWEVSMAVDMEIARRAAVFIGNGWSSFTSNIVHRRLVDGKPPISIRFY